MFRKAQSSKSKVQSSIFIAISWQLLAGSYFCGWGVVGWWDKLCTNVVFYTHAHYQRLAAWVQNRICAQFLRICSSVLSTYKNQIYHLLFIIYAPFPQDLLLKQLSK